MIEHRRSDVRPLWGALLIALGAVLLVETTGLVPGSTESWIGTTVLAALGVPFLAMYLAERSRWWALIPAGTLLSLAVVTAAGPFVSGIVSGAILLFGMAGTFAVVAVAPTAGRTRTWAWIPAAVLAGLGAVTLGSIEAEVFWPAALILIGAFLIGAWAVRRRQPGG
ncbi:MAG TPA: hypothetical protein VOB72_23645 [Candidatus Dormibacteraeota bacterium]|nr:hypothetical protein [Candidatus Dormibacteraeota bacterium]